jgi:PAS domain S-box-containing protein
MMDSLPSRISELAAAMRAIAEPASAESPLERVLRAAGQLFPGSNVTVAAPGESAGGGSAQVLESELNARGRPLGRLRVERAQQAAPFEADDADLFLAFAAHAALALDRGAADSHRFLDAIVENIPHMVFVKEAERLAFALFNRAGEELLGIPRDQLIGKNDYDFFPQEDADFFQKKDRETLSNKVLVDIPEEPLETARGTRWLHTKKVPIMDESGTPRYMLGISEDITERKAAETALRQAKDDAETAMRELEAFSYSVAHDLRAPLRSIDGFSQLLLEENGERLDEEGKRQIGIVRDSAQRMGQLIDALLLLSRVARSELRRDRVDLSALARHSLSVLEHLGPERQAQVTIQEGVFASGDQRLLGLLLDNLLGNAWKFTSKRADAKLEFGIDRSSGRDVYFVRDNGAGFDMKDHDKLFGAFTRLHSQYEFEGNGIGLATVQRIVARHGGSIWAEGATNQGATFFFTLAE